MSGERDWPGVEPAAHGSEGRTLDWQVPGTPEHIRFRTVDSADTAARRTAVGPDIADRHKAVLHIAGQDIAEPGTAELHTAEPDPTRAGWTVRMVASHTKGHHKPVRRWIASDTPRFLRTIGRRAIRLAGIRLRRGRLRPGGRHTVGLGRGRTCLIAL